MVQRLWALALAGLLASCLGGEPKAQPAASGRLEPVLPPQTARDALTDSYGQGIVKEFGSILRDSADDACLKAKGIDREQLDKAAADLLGRYGQKLLDATLDVADPEIFEKEFTRLGGKGARAEARRLASDPVVKAYLEANRPARHDRIVAIIAEHLDRYMIVKRYRLDRDLSPASGANESVLALDRSGRIEADIDAFIEKNKANRKLQRFLDLSDSSEDALKKAMIGSKRLKEFSPLEAFAGIATELEGYCIRL
jgi:hypothetical protein